MKAEIVLLLTQVVSERIDKNEMFTCFDITRILRHRGCMVDHEEVRKVIHGLHGTDLPPFRSSGYVRNGAVMLNGVGVRAEVYAPVKSDARFYDPNALNPSTPSVKAPAVSVPAKTTAPQVSPAKTTAPATAPKGLSKGTKIADDKRRFVERDNRGRASVHNGFVQKLGLNPKSLAYVAKRNGGDGLVVMPKPSKTGLLATYRVDKSGNVRISRNILKAGGLDGAKKIKLRLTDNTKAVILLKN